MRAPQSNHGTMTPCMAERMKTTSEYGSDIDLCSITTSSDYGSDIGFEDIDEDTILAEVLDTFQEAKVTEKSVVLPSVEFEDGELEDEEQNVNGDGFVQIHRPTLLRVAKGGRDIQSSPLRERQALEVEYDERSRQLWSVPAQDTSSKQRPRRAEQSPITPEAVQAAENDTRPPLDRFRTKPKKPLSVTDLVSPAWCELQYFYTLSKFGRKPRTQAMRKGSKIHQKLEDEVHTTVPVRVQSSEDRFGLRMWNVISGLRCLHETGLTRELEVWGVIQGQVVNGIIDELSHTCPDPVYEEQVERAQAEIHGGVIPLPPGQMSISQVFANAGSQDGESAWAGGLEPDRQVYVADVKTRSIFSKPTGASLRPTWMQLMLYRNLLESLSLNTVDAETVFARYDVKPLEPFSPMFLEAISGPGPGSEAANYPNLLSLWALLITEIQIAVPPTSLSPILRAEFRYSKTGDVIGSELTVYKTDTIDEYIAEEMAWWKGVREAKGVEVEEAFKCRICDFADDCSWRKMKVEEATEKTRLRRLAREKSAV